MYTALQADLIAGITIVNDATKMEYGALTDAEAVTQIDNLLKRFYDQIDSYKLQESE